MKTLILYATKYGAAREVAERIGKRIDGAKILDLKSGEIPALADFDCIIVGSSIYAGSILKEAKAFLAGNTDSLNGKIVGLFISGLSEGEADNAFKANFPASILDNAKAKVMPGGVFDPQKAGFVAKLVMKAVTKQSGYVNTINDEKIDKFVQELK